MVRVENFRTYSLLLLVFFFNLYKLYSRTSTNGHLSTVNSPLQQTHFLFIPAVHTFALIFASEMRKVRLQYIMPNYFIPPNYGWKVR